MLSPVNRADVAELADALDSKSGIRKDVWVRPPPSAPPPSYSRFFFAVIARRLFGIPWVRSQSGAGPPHSKTRAMLRGVGLAQLVECGAAAPLSRASPIF